MLFFSQLIKKMLLRVGSEGRKRLEGEEGSDACTYVCVTCPESTLSSVSAIALTCSGEWGSAPCTIGSPNRVRKILMTATTTRSQW